MKKIILVLSAFALSLSANSLSSNIKLKVVRSTPVYKTVAKQTPYTRCYDAPKHYRHISYESRRRDDSGLGTLIGGIAGGIIGNQVGKGRGKTVATIGGAIVGSVVGNNLSRQRYYDEPRFEHVRRDEQRCQTQYSTKYVDKFIGYKNVAYYKGNKIIKITPNKQRYIYARQTLHY